MNQGKKVFSHFVLSILVGLVLMIKVIISNAIVAAAGAPGRPNIVIILGDDLGFADMGSFGSEIKTPNLDTLANDGVRFTNFYTHASCSPTRAMLLSGVDTHLNGLGNMDEWAAPNQWGIDGYEGVLNDRVATLPQLLKEAGYHTYMTGKWHLGKKPEQIPAARGFERDFSLLDGAGSYWDMTNFTAASPQLVFTEDGHYLTHLPDDYYATKTYIDKLIGYIEANRGDGKPFFAYFAPSGAARPVSDAARVAFAPCWRVRQGMGRGATGAAEAANRTRHHARGHPALRENVVHPRPDRAGSGYQSYPR